MHKIYSFTSSVEKLLTFEGTIDGYVVQDYIYIDDVSTITINNETAVQGELLEMLAKFFQKNKCEGGHVVTTVYTRCDDTGRIRGTVKFDIFSESAFLLRTIYFTGSWYTDEPAPYGQGSDLLFVEILNVTMKDFL